MLSASLFLKTRYCLCLYRYAATIQQPLDLRTSPHSQHMPTQPASAELMASHEGLVLHFLVEYLIDKMKDPLYSLRKKTLLSEASMAEFPIEVTGLHLLALIQPAVMNLGRQRFRPLYHKQHHPVWCSG